MSYTRGMSKQTVEQIVNMWYQGLGCKKIADVVGVDQNRVRRIRTGESYSDYTGGPLDESKRVKPDPHLSRKRADLLRGGPKPPPPINYNRDPKTDPIAGDVLGNISLECTVLEREHSRIRYESRGMFSSGKINSWMDVAEWTAWATNPTYFVEVRKRGDISE